MPYLTPTQDVGLPEACRCHHQIVTVFSHHDTPDWSATVDVTFPQNGHVYDRIHKLPCTHSVSSVSPWCFSAA